MEWGAVKVAEGMEEAIPVSGVLYSVATLKMWQQAFTRALSRPPTILVGLSKI
jgi:hypothetical protein